MIETECPQQKTTERSPFVVALTGGIASGKTTVSDLFHKLYGVCVVDADVIAREVVAIGQPALTAIEAHFGGLVLNNDGSLNRSYLRARIFKDANERDWLNNLLHPLIRQEMNKYLSACQSEYVIAVVPLLVETGVPDFVDFVLVVDCSPQTQLQRLLQRDKIDQELAKSIVTAQATRDQRLSAAQGVILNEVDTSILQLTQQLNHWHKVLVSACRAVGAHRQHVLPKA